MSSECRVIHGSCYDHLDLWKTADVQICDAPYSPWVHRNAVSQSPGRGVRERGFDFDCLSDSLRDYISGIAATIKRWSVIFCDTEGLSAWKASLEKAGATYIRAMPWIRFSMAQLRGDRPPQGHEMIVIAYGSGKGRKHWNGPGNFTAFTQRCLRGENKHKAEKPLDLMLTLVDWFSDPGETVVDPCTGSGTTGLSCKLLGRNFIGTEIDAKWANHAAQRLLCDAGSLVPRDRERYERWLEQKKLEEADKIRRAEINAKARRKAEEKRSA